jgi:hypothetical protein
MYGQRRVVNRKEMEMEIVWYSFGGKTLGLCTTALGGGRRERETKSESRVEEKENEGRRPGRAMMMGDEGA